MGPDGFMKTGYSVSSQCIHRPWFEYLKLMGSAVSWEATNLKLILWKEPSIEFVLILSGNFWGKGESLI